MDVQLLAKVERSERAGDELAVGRGCEVKQCLGQICRGDAVVLGADEITPGVHDHEAGQGPHLQRSRYVDLIRRVFDEAAMVSS